MLLKRLRIFHRYLSLSLAAVWILQAVTGILLVYHWELDDLAVSGPAHPLDLMRFASSLDRQQKAHPDRTVSAVYASGGRPGRFDVLINQTSGESDALREDGEGTVLRQRPANYDNLHIGIYQIATYLHQTLFVHQAGRWVLGLSGGLLLSNLVLGLGLAWPGKGRWRRALMPVTAAVPSARVYAWHRAAGLWLALPVVPLVCAGVLMALDEPLARWFDDARPPPSLYAAGQESVCHCATPINAIASAQRLYPGAQFAALDMPTAQRPWFAVRVKQARETRRTAGTTVVYISSRSARVLAHYDALKSPLKTRVWDALYALHTGEIGGEVGRCAAFVGGLWLLSMIALGLTLWALRRVRGSSRHKVSAWQNHCESR